jgi:hypothetical protein
MLQVSGVEVQGGALDRVIQIAEADLNELDGVGLIRKHTFNVRGTFQFDVTRDGRRYVEEIRQRGEPLRAPSRSDDPAPGALEALAANYPRSGCGPCGAVARRPRPTSSRRRRDPRAGPFRQACGSLLFDAGQERGAGAGGWLGHHTPSFTHDTYVHPMDDRLGGRGLPR